MQANIYRFEYQKLSIVPSQEYTRGACGIYSKSLAFPYVIMIYKGYVYLISVSTHLLRVHISDAFAFTCAKVGVAETVPDMDLSLHVLSVQRYVLP